MATRIVKLPDIGEGVAEAELSAWHVKIGDVVSEDQILAEVTTDKATVEIPSPVAGTILALGGEVGSMLAVGGELVRLDVPAVTDEAKPATSEEATPAPSHAEVDRPAAAPAVRKRAQDAGIDLRQLRGSGPAGRIEHSDLDAWLHAGAKGGPMPAGRTANTQVETVKILGLRRTIARKMAEAKRRVAHFSYVEEVDVTALEALRTTLNANAAAGRPKLTLLPFLMQALVMAVAEVPLMNAHYDDEAEVIQRYGGVHIGIATQTPSGLLVPVVRHAEARDIWDCAAEVQRLAASAREGHATREELGGSTITITSLGALGGIASTPVINWPEVAILGVNRMAVRPVWQDGSFVPRKMMNLSSSFDHRVVDGYDAARFIQRIRTLLESPALIFIGS